jgi:hypothetical protein
VGALAAELRPTVRALVATNLRDFVLAELRADWDMILSPVWEDAPSGLAIRRVGVMPRSMRAHYLDGDARALLDSDDLVHVVAATLVQMNRDARLAIRVFRELSDLYADAGAPYRILETPWQLSLGVLTAIIADAARKARVGMSPREIIDSHDSPHPALAPLEKAARAGTAPIEDLAAALARHDLAG